MRYLLFTIEYPPFKGGVANYYDNLIKHWPDKDNNPISVLHNNGNNLIHPVWRWLPSFGALSKEVKSSHIGHILVGQILPLGTVAMIIARIFRIRYSVFLHGMDLPFALRRGRKRVLAKMILAGSYRIICSNSYVADMAIDQMKLSRERFIIANPGVDDFVVSENVKKSIADNIDRQGKFIIFSLGRLVRRKGFDRLIESFQLILNKIPNSLLCIAGAGPDEPYLRTKIGLLPPEAARNIRLLGKISDEEKNAWLSICDVFAMPARDIDGDFEGFGIVYLEAGLAGKPVVGGNCGGVRDAIEQGITGLLINPDNIHEIADSLISLGTDSDLRERLGSAGRHSALEKFNWDKRIKYLYDSII